MWLLAKIRKHLVGQVGSPVSVKKWWSWAVAVSSGGPHIPTPTWLASLNSPAFEFATPVLESGIHLGVQASGNIAHVLLAMAGQPSLSSHMETCTVCAGQLEP